MRHAPPAPLARPARRTALAVLTLLVAGLAASAEEMKSFAYRKTPQGEMQIHVHYPPGWKADDRRPAIVFFFGGGWTGGTVKQFEPQATHLARRGMVAARADYRVKSRQNVTPDACVEDAQAAVRWLRANAAAHGIDPDRIAAGGGSAGGHLAACTAVSAPLEPGATVSAKPNLLVLYNPALLDAAFFAQRGAPPDRAKAIDAVANLSQDAPPAILFYGTKDAKYLPGGKAYAAKAKRLGLAAALYTAEGVGHGFFNKAPWLESTLRQADQFLVGHGYLEGESALDVPPGATLKKEE